MSAGPDDDESESRTKQYKRRQCKRKVSRQIKRNVQSVPCEGTDLSRERERENAIKSTASAAAVQAEHKNAMKCQLTRRQ